LNINELKEHLGLYLTKLIDIFLNDIKGFGEHLGLYLTGFQLHAPLFSLPSPSLLIVGMVLSPSFDNIVPVKPVTWVVPSKALIANALPKFPTYSRTRPLPQPNPSVRHEHLATTLTTILSRHHRLLSLKYVMALLY